MIESGNSKYIFRVIKEENNVNFVYEYLLKFRNHDFLEDIYGEVEDDFFSMKDFDTYVLDIDGLERIAKIMKCSSIELMIRILNSCDVTVWNICDSSDLSVMIGSLEQVYERGISQLEFYHLKKDLDKVKEVEMSLQSIWNNSLSNTQFFKKNSIDMNKFVLFEEDLVVKKRIKRNNTNK